MYILCIEEYKKGIVVKKLNNTLKGTTAAKERCWIFACLSESKLIQLNIL